MKSWLACFHLCVSIVLASFDSIHEKFGDLSELHQLTEFPFLEYIFIFYTYSMSRVLKNSPLLYVYEQECKESKYTNSVNVSRVHIMIQYFKN